MAVNPQRKLKIDRLFFGLALFVAAEILLAISTRIARPWQWLALLLLIVTGLMCTVLITRARDTLSISTSTVIIIALLTRLPALLAAPLLDDDYFRFLWDGHQLVVGLSPYASAPSRHFLRDDLSSAWSAVLSEINHPDVPTIYGPSLQVLFALAVALSDADPWALKLIFVATDVALVIVLLRAGCARWLVLLYVVNPLVVKEIGFSLHPDGVIALSLPLAVIARRQDATLLLTPWLGSFALLLGYANGSTLADFGITGTRGEFSVFPVATVAQLLLMVAGFAYDLRRCLVDAGLWVAVRIPMSLSNALIRQRFPSVTQIPPRRVWDSATAAQPTLWIDVTSACCPLDLAGRAQAVTSFIEAQALATTFQQQHRRGQIVISCAVGYRSSEMAAQLTRAGIENVSNVEGGRRALAHLRGCSRR